LSHIVITNSSLDACDATTIWLKSRSNKLNVYRLSVLHFRLQQLYTS